MAHVLIHGRVQGVGFRYWLAGEAQSRGLDGWVRNRQDGSVEAVFGGPDEAVKDMLTVCSIGPRLAKVGQVEMLDDGDDVCEGFEIRPSL
ncbi:MAG: acylphosphatase [Aestuariivirgaceae bacterium]